MKRKEFYDITRIRLTDDELKILKLANARESKYFKDYEELKKYFGLIDNGGNGKKKNIKELKRFMDLEQEKFKHPYRIKKVYEKVFAEETNRKNERVITLEKAFLAYVTENKYDEINATTKQLMQYFGFANFNYSTSNIDKFEKIVMEYKLEPLYDIDEFFDIIRTKLVNDITETFLKSLVSRNIINYNKYLIKVVFLNDDDDKPMHVKCNSKERDSYFEMYNELLKEMGIQKLTNYNSLRFFDRLNKKLKEKYGWEQAYYKYCIFINEDLDYKNIIGDKTYEYYRQEANKLAINTIIKEAEIRKEKNKKQVEEEIAKVQKRVAIGKGRINKKSLDENFMDMTKKLIKFFISIEETDMYDFLKTEYNFDDEKLTEIYNKYEQK